MELWRQQTCKAKERKKAAAKNNSEIAMYRDVNTWEIRRKKNHCKRAERGGKEMKWNKRRRCWVVVELAPTNNMTSCQMGMECACCRCCYDSECIQHLNNAVRISAHSTERFVCFSNPVLLVRALRCATLYSAITIVAVSECVCTFMLLVSMSFPF